MNLIKQCEAYIKKYELDITPEALFIEFHLIMESHIEFDNYLKEKKYDQHLEKMQRNKRLSEKRKLFVDWYIQKYQNKKMIKEIIIDLSEMAFVTTKTIKNEFSRETTGLGS